MNVEYKQFQRGQQVGTVYGETRTVLFQRGCQVFVEEDCNGHYHPSKLTLIESPTAPIKQDDSR